MCNLLWRYAQRLKGALVHVRQLLPVQNPGVCTCVSPHQSVPMSAAQGLSGLRKSYRKKTSDIGARRSTREQGRHVSTEVGCHSSSGSSTTPSPLVQSPHVWQILCLFQLCGATGTLDTERKGIINDFIIPASACGPFGSRLADIHGEFGRIMEIKLAELVVSPQLLSLIIMTVREIYILKRWRAFLLLLITFHLCRNKSFT